MKIIFLKHHQNYKAGSSVDLPDSQANYFIRMKIAELSTTTQLPGINPNEVIPSNPQLVKENLFGEWSKEKVEHKIVKEKVEYKESPVKEKVQNPKKGKGKKK